MTCYRISFLLLLFGLTAFTCRANESAAASFTDCLNYEPDPVTLVGTVSRKTFLNVSEQKEIVWILELAKPICVNADEGSDFNLHRTRVSEVQLVLEPEMFGKYRRLLGKKVKATGTLFGEHTAHHFTPVLLDVTEIRSQR